MKQDDIKEADIKKNYLYSTFYQVLTMITPLVTAPYASRIFGPEGVGIQSYTASVVSVFCIFAALGTAVYGQREIAIHRNDPKAYSRVFWEIEILSIFATVVCLIIFLMVILVHGTFLNYYILQSMTILAVLFDISWFFAGFEAFKYIVFRNLTVKLFGIFALFCFVHDKNDLALYVGLVSASGLLGNISTWTYLRRYLVKIRFIDFFFIDFFDRERKHLKQTIVYFVPAIATSVYTILDKVMIGFFCGDKIQNGYYEQTTRIVKLCLTLILSINTVMTSRMSWLFAQNKTLEVKIRLRQSMDFSIFLAVPLILGICGIAHGFVPWFLGDGYEEVVHIIYFYSPLIYFISISNCCGSQYLTPTGQRVKSGKVIIAGAFIDFCLNLIMIPVWEAKGAAIASVIAEFAIAILYVKISDDYMTWHIIWQCTWKRFLSAGIMFCAIYIMGQLMEVGIMSTLVQIVAGAAIYFLMLFIFMDNFLVSYIGRIVRKTIDIERDEM